LTALVSVCWFAHGEWATARLTEDSRDRVNDEAMIEEGYR
jgi:hypothetical protein